MRRNMCVSVCVCVTCTRSGRQFRDVRMQMGCVGGECQGFNANRRKSAVDFGDGG